MCRSTKRCPHLSQRRSLFRRDNQARLSSRYWGAERGTCYLCHLGPGLNKERPSVRLNGRGSDLCLGGRWTAREIAIGAATTCFVIAGLSTEIALSLLFGAAGITVYLYLKFND